MAAGLQASAYAARFGLDADAVAAVRDNAVGVQPRPGDVILIRTAWYGRHEGDASTHLDGEPGIDPAGAAWLAEAGVAAFGADNYAIEVLPFVDDDVFPVHKLLLRDYGIPLIEGVVLDELAAAGAGEFLFVAAPQPAVGGTASPVCPLAVL